jgi:glucose/arabinose dehydrogenase
MRTLISNLCLLLAGQVMAQTAGQLTPVITTNLVNTTIEVPPPYRTAFATARNFQMPTGFRAKVFYAGNLLSKARFMAFSADSVLHVANKNSGTVVALPDRNRDGVADTAFVAASGLSGAHDVRFFRGAMYVALQRQVIKLEDRDGNGNYETRSTFIDNIASGAQQPGGGHDTRTIVFDERNQKMYLSIGSLCNVCRETARAIVEEYDLNGQNRRVFATGIRNAVGMTLHPVTNRLWANNNGSDNQGNDVPPEWIDIIRDGGFYGYPFAHSFRQWFNFGSSAPSDYRALLPMTAADSAMMQRMAAPAALVQAHSAPMALTFSNTSMPPQYRQGLWCVYRGSWNRTPATGYKVVYLDFTDAQDTLANSVTDIITGFQTPSVWGRPVGLALDQRGNLYLGTDDGAQAIFHISTNAATSSQELAERIDFKLFPNPVQQQFSIQIPDNLLGERVEVEVFDAVGRLVLREILRGGKQAWQVGDWAAGQYLCRVNVGSRFGTQTFMVVK